MAAQMHCFLTIIPPPLPPPTYRDERQPFADQSLYTADSENEEDKRRTKKAQMKMEESSGIEGVDNEESQKPLNSMFVLMVILKVCSLLM